MILGNFYFIVFYIVSISLLVYRKPMIDCTRSRRDNSFLFLTLGYLLCLNCFRGIDVGNDTSSYKILFDYYTGKGTLLPVSNAGLEWMNEYVDIGYRTINVLFSYFSSSYQLFISLVAIFLYFTLSRFIKRESTNVSISVLFFFLEFYHPYLNVLRQAIAISIILYGFNFLKRGKPVKFCLFVLCACLFHKTAIIALLLLPLMNIKHFSAKRTAALIVLVIGLTATKTVSRALSLIGYSGMYSTEEQGISTYAQILLSTIIFLLINYWRGNPLKNYIYDLDNSSSKLERFYSRIPIVHLCLSIVGLNLPIVYRGSYYFTIFYIAGIPYYLTKSTRKRSNIKITLYFFFITYIIYQTGILVFRPEWVTEFQYKFFWQ